MGVYIGTKDDYSAMQGPCPDGFHVPLKTEWEAIYNIGVDLGIWSSSDGAGLQTYLKLPYAGYIQYYAADYYNRGSKGLYWAADADPESNYYQSYHLYFSSSSSEVNQSFRTNGQSIRPFSNTPVAPDSSWTSLYSDKIYHNSTLGLISISSDGSNWITIADKNLGATSVRNSGDGYSDANCGKYYQRGNCNGFGYTSAKYNITSSTVDASTYGPGNYFTSTYFVKGRYNWDTSDNLDLRGGETGTVKVGQELKNAYIGEYVPPYLCFTANTANSTVQLIKNLSPISVTLETSTDGKTWSNYTIGDTITLSNIGDKVYMRNKSDTDTGFSLNGANYYQFVMAGSIAGRGNVTALLNKNGTDTLSNYCFLRLFDGCSSLTTPPKLPATILAEGCYMYLFYGCTNLTTLPSLQATSFPTSCCAAMFSQCSKIKLSATQTGEYQTPYRIPTTGNGSVGSGSLQSMFQSTGGTFTGTPSINTTYYTSNTVV